MASQGGITVNPAAPTKLAWTGGPAVVGVGVCTGVAYTVASEDQYGNVSNTVAQRTINLASTGAGVLYTAGGGGAGTNTTSINLLASTS